ncbi:hypothetical protein FOZ63_025635, partial [Perkinsus olseni]
AMEESLGWLVKNFGVSTFAVVLILLAIFVDDGIAGSSERGIVKAALALLYVLSVCGFGCSPPKMQFITAFEDLPTDGFIEPSSVLQHLSCCLSYVDRSLRACRQNEERLAEVFSLCEKLLAEGKKDLIVQRKVRSRSSKLCS